MLGVNRLYRRAGKLRRRPLFLPSHSSAVAPQPRPEGQSLIPRSSPFATLAALVDGVTRQPLTFTAQENGDVLYSFTMDDDTVWTQPWTGEYIWQASDDKVYEYACHEGNYALGNIMRGARILEKDILEGKSGTD